MKFEVFHQLGWRHNWNFQSHADDGVGHGFIFGPRYLEREVVEGQNISLRSHSFFDPQFFLPNTPKKQLATYDFFPDVAAGGFETSEWTAHAATSALNCINFQINNNFRYIVIPTRYIQGARHDYIDTQTELFVGPFTNAITSKRIKGNIALQLIVNQQMLLDEAYFNNLLNWITGIKELSAVYLILDTQPRTTKQIDNIDLLLAYLKFIDAISENKLEVILGYLNTEAFILTLANPKIITIGSYENLRMFNIKGFEDDGEKKEMRGPNARVYFSKLLNHIEHHYLGAMQRSYSNYNSILDINHYQAAMFRPSFQWNFNKPELYKHYFLVFFKQLQEINSVSGKARYEMVKALIEQAIYRYSEIKQCGVIFDENNNERHLARWLTAINEFAKFKGWF